MTAKRKTRKVLYKDKEKEGHFKVPLDQSKKVPMKFAKGSMIERIFGGPIFKLFHGRKATIEEINPATIAKDTSFKLGRDKVTVIDEQGRQTTYFSPHAMAAVVKTVEINGKKCVRKVYSTESLRSREVMNHVEQTAKEVNELVKKGAPFPKKLEIKREEGSLIITEEKRGECLELIKKTNQTEKKDIMKELNISLEKLRKLNIAPGQMDPDHILYDKNALEGSKINFVKPIVIGKYKEEYAKGARSMVKKFLNKLL